jgi:hypothetical protein
MGLHVWLAATVAALSLLLLGCDGSSPDAQSAPSAEATSADHAAAVVDAPDEGTCRNTPSDPNLWFDDSPTVPCTEPHTIETVDVLRLTEPTISEAKEASVTCWDRVSAYLGVDADSWVPWMYAYYLPSREQIADGANWMRCDAAFPETWAFSSLRTTTGTAAGIADNPPAEFWACLDEHPQKLEQPFVLCDQPHQYEQTGTLAILDGLEQYPSPAELDATARRQCAHSIPEAGDDVALTARWDPRSALRDGTSIAGTCFMFDRSGQPLPPRQ